MLLVYPEFTTESLAEQTRITSFIGKAARRIDPSKFTEDTNDAVLALGAHLITMASRNNEARSGGVGPLSSRTTGEQIVSFNNPTEQDGYNFLRATNYGAWYLDLLNDTAQTPLVSS